MFTVEKTAVIARPQHEVFAFVANPANAAQWQSTIKSKEWMSAEPPDVGSRQRATARWLGLKIDSVNEFTVWDPPQKLRFQTSRGPLRIEEGMSLEAVENGTILTWSMRVASGGIFGLLEGFLESQAEKTMPADLAVLKRCLEEGSA